MASGEGGDSRRTFALKRLFIDSAFASDDEIGAGDVFFEVQGGGDEIKSRTDLRLAEGEEPEAETSRGSCPWGIAEVAPQVGSDAVGEGAEPTLEDPNGFGVRALLGAEDGRRSAWTEEGILDIASGDDFGEFQSVIGVDPRQGDEMIWAEREFFAVAGQKFVAKGAGEADPAVGGGATAETDENFFGTSGRRVGDELSRAQGVGAQRGEFFGGQPPDARGRAHFHDGELLGLDPCVTGDDLASEGIEDGGFHPDSAESAGKSFGKAFAAIGDGSIDDGRFWPDGEQALPDGCGGGKCGKRAFEFIGRDDDLHRNGLIFVKKRAGDKFLTLVEREMLAQSADRRIVDGS